MANQLFAVVGSGPGGLATAAHLTFMGHSVNLLSRSEDRIQNIIQGGGVHTKGAINGFAKLNKITTSPADAIDQAVMIMIVIPANAHKHIAELLATHLRDGQIVLLCPGRTGGAIEFYQTLLDNHVKADVILAETQTILYTCRLSETPNLINVLAIKERVPFSVFPAIKTSKAVSIISSLFPQYVVTPNVLDTSFNNVGCILHPAPTLLNIGWIESPRTSFSYYYEGITPTVARLLENLDEERLSVGRRLGANVLSVQEWLKETYASSGQNLYESVHNNKYYETIDAPTSVQHRYLLEDVPTGLVPISSFGHKFGIKTILTDHIIELASLTCDVDFQRTGRTIESLKLGCYDLERLWSYIEYGQ